MMNARPFKRVLVANRGEIAVRIIRGCHEEGVEAIAVYSEVDADALHVRMADDAVCIGAAPSTESYLRTDAVIQAAKTSGCDAVHPGYGFLSENASFAQRVIDEGWVWIGPPPDAIRDMGSKTRARKTMVEAGVPVVPGTVEPVETPEEAGEIAASIGYPVMLKAAAGGGGKGMRRVDSADGLALALQAAQSEATKSFGDGAVYIEKLVVEPRHVEIQLLADVHGEVIHLFERDCSVQRRHQKVLEEAPCPVIKDETRQAMASAACQAARAVNYVGAGTCEFLLAKDGSFYFLEMNTRLQVEHPITEMITGVDLVRAQLRVATGEALWLKQEDLAVNGHAIECRIYAEDARAGWRPAPGVILAYREPSGPFVRVDSGVASGSRVSIHYDPMVAKLVVWGRNRGEAIARCARALREYRILGITTSIPFFLALLEDPDFLSGNYNTGFLSEEWIRQSMASSAVDETTLAALAAIVQMERSLRTQGTVKEPNRQGQGWKRAHAWRWQGR